MKRISKRCLYVVMTLMPVFLAVCMFVLSATPTMADDILHVNFVNWIGEEGEHWAEPLTGEETKLGGSEWSEYWYVVTEDTVFTHQVTVEGDVNLILSDDTTLEFNYSANTAGAGDALVSNDAESELNIYCQSGRNGELHVTTMKNQKLIVYGGNIHAQNIENRELTMYRGSLETEDGFTVIGDNDNENWHSAFLGGSLVVHGEFKLVNESFDLLYTNPTDSFYAGTINLGAADRNLKILIDEGYTYYYEDMLFTGEYDRNKVSNLSGKELRPYFTYNVNWVVNDEIVQTDSDVLYGNSVKYNGPEPTKDPDNQCTYIFTGWSDGETTYTADEIPDVTCDVTYTAKFIEEPEYTPDINVTGNGSVTASPEACKKGEAVTLIVETESGYALKTLTAKDINGEPVTITDNTLIMPEGGVSVFAEFEKLFSVTGFADETGSVTADKEVVLAGDTVTLEITPAAHYLFESVRVTDESGEEISLTDNQFVMPSANVSVTASFYESYEIYVGSVLVTEKNKADIFGDNTVAYEGNRAAGTLYLKNRSITEEEGFRWNSNIYVDNKDLALTIELIGENQLSGASYGVNATCNSITIAGEGSLSVNAATEAMWLSRCSLMIDGTTVTLDAKYNFAIEANAGTITIKDSQLTAVSGGYMAIDGQLVEITGSKVNADAKNIGYAIYGSEGISITDSTVVSNAAVDDACNSGRGDFTVTNSNVTLTGKGFGIQASNNSVTITDSIVNATGGKTGCNCSGVLTIANSTVTMSSEQGAGITANNSMVITDSIVRTTGNYQGLRVSGKLSLEGKSELTVIGNHPGYASFLVGSLDLGDGFVISTPENGVVKFYDFYSCDAVYESDGETLADKVVITAEAAPKFKKQSLLLSGEIGVNFFMELPEIEGVDYTKSYMEFSVSGKGGKTTRAEYDSEKMNQTNEYYCFTCYVNAIQMADTITATFHYNDGEDKAIVKTYSVKEYLDAITTGNFPEELIALAVAIGDYGYYAQTYLSAVRGFSLGTDYAAMSPGSVYEETDYTTTLEKVAPYAIVKDSIGAEIEKLTYSLVLDSATDIRIYLKPAEDFTGKVTAIIGSGTKNAAVKQKDGRYRIQISGISAHMLANMYSVNVTAGESFDIQVSALSYADSILKSANADISAKNMAVAIYKYYEAAMKYKDSVQQQA